MQRKPPLLNNERVERQRRARRWQLAVLCIASCTTESVTPPISTLDGRRDVEPTMRRDIEALDPNIDTDHDGIADVDERAGWEIRVDSTGRPQGIETVRVTSDPSRADTDNDGLPDGLERISGADPNRADTDGDGLNDVEEVQRWGTSPASVDSDADSRGRNPDPSAAPNVALFDAAELKLVDDPANPGQRTSAVDATNPLLEDTDGDGVSDFDEVRLPTRSAVRAEVPALTLTQSANSALGLFLTTTETRAMGTSREYGSSRSFDQNINATTTVGNTTTAAAYISMLVEFGATLDIGINIENLGGALGIVVNADNEFGLEASNATRLGVSSGTSTTWAQDSRTVQSQLEEQTHTVTGGRVTLSTTLKNTGDVAFRLRNLRVHSAFYDDARGRVRALTTLRPINEPNDGVVLARGESTNIIVESRDVETERLLSLMNGTSSFFVQPASYDVLDAGDEHYAFRQQRVVERTSMLTIEDGSAMPQTYRIATNVRRDAQGREAGLSVAEILRQQNIAFMAQPISDGSAVQKYIFEIGGRRTVLHTGAPPSLNDPAYPPGISPGDRLVRHGWFAMFHRRDGRTQFEENMFNAVLRPGDRVNIVYAVDEDRDGLCELEEQYAGTSDSRVDSDGDGLSDFFEVRGGWSVEVSGEPAFIVRSSPTNADADRDGLNDRAEAFGARNAQGYLVGTHPRLADTDRDGHNDSEEAASTTDALDPLRYDNTEFEPVLCTNNARDASYRLEPVTSWYRAVDNDTELASVTLRFRGGREETIRHTPGHTLRGQIVNPIEVRAVFATDVHGTRTPVAYCVPGGEL